MKKNTRQPCICIFLGITIFLLRLLVDQVSVEERHSVEGSLRIEFIQKVSAPHFSSGVLSTLLPATPSASRSREFNNVGLTRKSDDREKHSRFINISDQRHAMCWSFINISTHHALSFHCIAFFLTAF